MPTPDLAFIVNNSYDVFNLENDVNTNTSINLPSLDNSATYFYANKIQNLNDHNDADLEEYLNLINSLPGRKK